RVDGVDAALVARWDGTRWQPLPDTLPHSEYEGVRAFATYRGELVAAGPFHDPLDESRPNFFARWNGAGWAALGTDAPEYADVERLRAIGTDLYAVGNFPYGPRAHGISRWDGSTWHVDEDTLRLYVDDVALFQNDLHAAGALVRDGDHAA